MTGRQYRFRFALLVALAGLAASAAHAQARDTVVIASVSPVGTLRYGTPTEFVIVADVTLASADSAVLVAGFNTVDPSKYRIMASEAIRRGTQRITLRASVTPVDWAPKGRRFGYIVDIRPRDLPFADGTARGLATVHGEIGAGPPKPAEKTYFEFQVDKPVRQEPGSVAPRYPVELKSAGVQGEVLAQFVVDTLGAPLMETLRILRSDHVLFAEAVKSALPAMHFSVAELGGKKVRQLVQQPFVFAIQGMNPPPAPARTVPPPSLGVTSITPAPRGGTVEGWKLAQRITVDSGSGASPVTLEVEMTGTAGRFRMEVHSSAAAPLGAPVLLYDSTTHRTSFVISTMKQVVVTRLDGGDSATMRHEVLSRPRTTKDLGPGERIAGAATRHFRIDGTTETRVTLGDRSCLTTQPTHMESWMTTDAVAVDVARRARDLLRLFGASAQVLTVFNLQNEHGPPGVPMRTIAKSSFVSNGGVTSVITTSREITAFSTGSIAAAVFDPPEGFQMRDMSGVVPPVGVDSIRRSAVEKLFARMTDSLSLPAGSTRNCTPAKVP